MPINKNGFPVPFFVDYVDGEPDFRIVDSRKFVRCVREHLCWLCGQILGRNMTYVIGPMCAINRVSSEPPCHLECAIFAARACPWMTRPLAPRRETDIPVEAEEPAGIAIMRNPGVVLLWTTREPVRPFKAVGGNEGYLFMVGEPMIVASYAQGRLATDAEVRASIDSGLPLLLGAAQQQGHEAVRDLESKLAVALRILRLGSPTTLSLGASTTEPQPLSSGSPTVAQA